MRGRKPTHDWPRLVKEQEKSGLSVTDFCTQNGLNAASLYKARQRRPESAARFVGYAPKKEKATYEPIIADDKIAISVGRYIIRIPATVETLKITIQTLAALSGGNE